MQDIITRVPPEGFYYEQTLVGFFDIHGYSSFIERTPNSKERIGKIIDFFKKMGYDADIYGSKVDRWILSDSIMLVVDTTRRRLFKNSLQMLLALCSNLMMYGMKNGFPLRGAIGGGDFYKDGEVMVSTALVDAHLYEKEQDWLGAVLTPKALEQVEKVKESEAGHKGEELKCYFSSDWFNPYVRYGVIPWKPGKPERKKRLPLERPDETFYIKPFMMAEKDWKKYLPDYFDKPTMITKSHRLYAQE